MDVLKLLNLLVRFFLELCMLAAVGYWGFKTQSGWTMRIIFGIGLPILIVVIWGLFVAPKAIYPLHGLSHMVLSLVLLGSGAVALFAGGRADLGWVYAIILILNQVLLIVWKQ
ncbi:MAG: DUF2568 domain-containing protein [Chloroflexi bacterium]|nr:MAG: DUF2568 domain-containing protein [Chloroflexota bacterium]